MQDNSGRRSFYIAGAPELAVTAPDGQPPAGYCANCGSPLHAGAHYCPRCGAKTVLGPAGREAPDNFKLGLLLIKIGIIVSVVMSILLIAGISWLSFLPGLPGPAGGVVTVFSSFVILGFVFAVIAALFHRDIANGNDGRIIHTIILSVLMFFLASNVTGALVGIGAYLCHVNRRSRGRSLS